MSTSCFEPAPPHAEEESRIASLHALALLDSPAQETLDQLISLAADVFDVETVLISLVDSNRQWFLSRHGLDACETDRDVAFCAYAIHEDEMLVVEDAAAHPVFCNNPLVTGDPFIRFYAGAVLRDETGLPLGTLCVIDGKPRQFRAEDRQRLRRFARIVRREMLHDTNESQRQARRKLDARRDPITGAYWGDAFFDVAERVTAGCIGGAVSAAVATVTLNNLTFFADTHGGIATDEVLLQITERLRATLGDYGAPLCGRLEGRQIVGVAQCIEAATPATLDALRRGLDDALTAGIETHAGMLFPRLTVIVAHHNNQRTLRETINLCQITARNQPSRENSCSLIVDDAMEASARYRFRVAADLPQALRDDDFSLVFQPKIRARDQQVTGFECLLRWAHPALGAVSPIQVLATAREAHCIPELERWVINNALTMARYWRDRNVDSGRLSINISSQTLLDRQFPSWFRDALDGHAISPDRVDLEIVESSLFDDFAAVVAVIRDLRALGVSFSLDDFGTGYSSLSYLRELPISHLKIDRSFIQPIVDEQDAAAMCSGIINLAHEIGMQTVAEGVENNAQFLTLRALRCDEIQGYYFARPMSGDAVIDYLRASEKNRPPSDH